MNRRTRMLAQITIGALLLALPLAASAATTYTDPVGDTLFHAPPYMDIVAAGANEDSGTFEFTMTVAATIPEAPKFNPPGVAATWWVFPLDLDPAAFPVGWPLPPPLGGAAEALIAVGWDGSAFSGTLYDRRPLLVGGDVEVTTVPFEIDGNTVRARLDGALIDDPSSFGWGAVVNGLPVFPGNRGYSRFVDWLPRFYNPWP